MNALKPAAEKNAAFRSPSLKNVEAKG